MNPGPDVISGKDERNSHIGLLVGATIPSTSGARPAAATGITLGNRFAPHLGVGLQISYFGQRNSGAFLTFPQGSETSVLYLLPQLQIYLDLLHFGVEGGLAFRSASGAAETLNGSGTSTTTFIFGPTLGYDYKLSRAFSLGAEAHALFTGSEAELTQFQAFFSIKLWL